jgi:polysaccharide biosynthesis transport protein
MAGGRGKLPMLGRISGPDGGDESTWALRRNDFEALAAPLGAVDGTRTILVTGGDGESRILAVALAAAATAAGRRTVLVEGDVERPRLAADLGLAAAPGLHEYLRWETTPEKVLQPLVLAGSAAAGAEEPLVCVVAGRPAEDPAALLALGSFRHMVGRLREAYALTVVLGPPLGRGDGGLDAIAAESEAVLLALPPSYGAGREAKSVGIAARNLGPRPLGAVLVG